MVKTIDTRNTTDIMLEAQNVIDGITTYSDPLSFKDAADIFIAMTEAAPLDSDTSKMVLELCDTIITGSIFGIVTKAKQIRKRLEAGE